jgi:hypothetical protein
MRTIRDDLERRLALIEETERRAGGGRLALHVEQVLDRHDGAVEGAERQAGRSATTSNAASP